MCSLNPPLQKGETPSFNKGGLGRIQNALIAAQCVSPDILENTNEGINHVQRKSNLGI